MRIIFTEEDGITHAQARYLRGGLLRNYHRVHVLRAFDRLSADLSADLWFHGLYHRPDAPFPDMVRGSMEQFKGTIVFFQNDDCLKFALDKIPPVLRERARLFLRNIWPADTDNIHPSIRSRTGLINPFLKPLRAREGKALINRPYVSSFFGAATGGRTLPRVKALQLLRQAGIPFTGGLFKAPGVEPPPPELSVQPLRKAEYFRVLDNTQLSLVLHGHNPLSFRFFEGFSRRSLVIAQDLSSIRFADCGLRAGQHYAAVRQDLSDLISTVRHYQDHVDEAQRIADAGYRHFKANFAFSGVNLPQPLYLTMIHSWKGMELPPGRKTPCGILIRWLLPVIHSL